MKPYPEQYVVESALATGARVVIRPIRPDDEAKMVHFHEGLSDRSVYQRYFHMMTLARRTAHARLTRVCLVDFDLEFALVAEGPTTAARAPFSAWRDCSASATAAWVSSPWWWPTSTRGQESGWR